MCPLNGAKVKTLLTVNMWGAEEIATVNMPLTERFVSVMSATANMSAPYAVKIFPRKYIPTGFTSFFAYAVLFAYIGFKKGEELLTEGNGGRK